MKLVYDANGWFSFPIYAIDLVDVLEDREEVPEKVPFKFYFIEWITLNMGGIYNNKTCSAFIFSKKTQGKAGEEYQFFATFRYFSKAKAQWKDIKIGLTSSEFTEFFNLYSEEDKNHMGFRR